MRASCERAELECLQLHGDETPRTLAALLAARLQGRPRRSASGRGTRAARYAGRSISSSTRSAPGRSAGRARPSTGRLVVRPRARPEADPRRRSHARERGDAIARGAALLRRRGERGGVTPGREGPRTRSRLRRGCPVCRRTPRRHDATTPRMILLPWRCGALSRSPYLSSARSTSARRMSGSFSRPSISLSAGVLPLLDQRPEARRGGRARPSRLGSGRRGARGLLRRSRRPARRAPRAVCRGRGREGERCQASSRSAVDLLEGPIGDQGLGRGERLLVVEDARVTAPGARSRGPFPAHRRCGSPWSSSGAPRGRGCSGASASRWRSRGGRGSRSSRSSGRSARCWRSSGRSRLNDEHGDVERPLHVVLVRAVLLPQPALSGPYGRDRRRATRGRGRCARRGACPRRQGLLAKSAVVSGARARQTRILRMASASLEKS